jgi:ParB-like nuclease domain
VARRSATVCTATAAASARIASPKSMVRNRGRSLRSARPATQERWWSPTYFSAHWRHVVVEVRPSGEPARTSCSAQGLPSPELDPASLPAEVAVYRATQRRRSQGTKPNARRAHRDREGLLPSPEVLGVLHPPLVRQLDDGRLELIAGERQKYSAIKAGHSAIPVFVRDLSPVHQLAGILVENHEREGLTQPRKLSPFSNWLVSRG